MDNAATRMLKRVALKLNIIDERQKETLFAYDDFIIEQNEKRKNSLKENH